MPVLEIKWIADQIIFDFCPAEPQCYLPLRAASVESYRQTQRCEHFIENLRVYLVLQLKLNSNHSRLLENEYALSAEERDAHHLCWAVRLGDLRLLKMLKFLKADPHQRVWYYEATSVDMESEVVASSLETAIARRNWDAVVEFGNWDAVVEFAAHSPPLLCPKFMRTRCVPWKSVPWHRLSKEMRILLQHLKEDVRDVQEHAWRSQQEARRFREDARRAVEDARREQEDATAARYDLRRARQMAKRQQPEVAMQTSTTQASEEKVEDDGEQDDEDDNKEDEQEDEDEDEERPVQKAMDENEASDLLAAIQASRADLPVLSADKVVLLRVTRMARSPLVAKVLLESPMLSHSRARVLDAGCEIVPKKLANGHCGPKLFVPCTEYQLAELAEAGFELLDHHILALQKDKAIINQALKASLLKKTRPAVSSEHGSAISQAMQEADEDYVVEEGGYATDSSVGYPKYERAD